MKINLHYLLTILLLYLSCYAPQLIITEVGDYPIGGDIPYTPVVTNDSIITISSNNVILDLGGRALSQTNAVAGLTGILVNPNLSNVTIQNGTILGLTGIGITISPGCSRVLINNVTVSGCALRGVDFTGAANNLISNSEIRNSSIINCSQSTTGDYALNLNQCTQMNVTRCNFYGNGNTTFVGGDTIHLVNVSQAVLQDLFVNASVGNTYNCISLFSNAQDIVLRNCFVVSCSAVQAGTTSSGFGIPAGSNSSANFFENCITASCQVNSGAFDGFLITVNNNIFNNCAALNNTNITGAFNGFVISNASTIQLNNCNVINNSCTGLCSPFSCLTTTTCTFIGCIAANNASTTSSINGFSLASIISCNLIRCISVNNRAPAGTSSGFNITTNPTGNTLQDCIAGRNVGSASATSFGFNFTAGTGLNNTFSRNTSMSNGTTAANLFSGFAANNQSATAGNATNVTTAPWTNVGITG